MVMQLRSTTKRRASRSKDNRSGGTRATNQAQTSQGNRLQKEQTPEIFFAPGASSYLGAAAVTILITLSLCRFYPPSVAFLFDSSFSIYDSLLGRIPLVREDPFVLTIFDAGPRPLNCAFWRYILTTAVIGPIAFMCVAMVFSLTSGEFYKQKLHKAFRYQMKQAFVGLFTSSPAIAYALKLLLEGRNGRLYFSLDPADSGYSLFYSLVGAPVGFFFIADTVFYWLHRISHESTFMYNFSHKWHHSCRPATSFGGNSADAFELVYTGYSNTVIPALLIPINAKVCLLLFFFNQVWSIQLHCNTATRTGMYLNDSMDHNLHHHFGQKNYNFGLYLQLWDRIMGTYKDKVVSKKTGKEEELYKSKGIDTH